MNISLMQNFKTPANETPKYKKSIFLLIIQQEETVIL